MRDIKFRAWNKEKNIMVYEDEDGSSEYFDGVCLSDIQMVNSIFKTDFNQYEWMQYTGLKDKNGKEIYEGDIVKQTYHKVIEFGDEIESFEGCHVGKVVIVSSGVCLKNPLNYDTDTGKTKTKGYKNIASYRCEVIGNIYENPELLEEL